MGTSIVAGCDATPVLDPAEHVFDAMSLLVEDIVIGRGFFAVFARRNAGRNPLFFQSIAEPVGVIAAIGQQFLGAWQTLEQLSGTLVVAHLARSQQEQQRPSQSIGDGVQLGIQAAFRSSDAAG